MTFHDLSRAVKSILSAIQTHPFITEFVSGELPQDTFEFYLQQDNVYLDDFARCNALLAAKAPSEFLHQFIQQAHDTISTEKNNISKYLTQSGTQNPPPFQLSPTTLHYPNFLLRHCQLSPFEVGFAALIPCFLVYHELSEKYFKHLDATHPYWNWLSSYQGTLLSKTLTQLTVHFDAFLATTTPAIRTDIEQAFQYSCLFELYFFDDCYHQRTFAPQPIPHDALSPLNTK